MILKSCFLGSSIYFGKKGDFLVVGGGGVNEMNHKKVRSASRARLQPVAVSCLRN